MSEEKRALFLKKEEERKAKHEASIEGQWNKEQTRQIPVYASYQKELAKYENK